MGDQTTLNTQVGFPSLIGLVSDVTAEIELANQAAANAAARSVQTPTSASTESSIPRAPARVAGGRRVNYGAVAAIAGLAIVVLAIVAVSSSRDESTPPRPAYSPSATPPSSYSAPSTYKSPPAYVPPVDGARSATDAPRDRPEATVSSKRLLTLEQLRWCLYEQVRIQSGRDTPETQSQVDAFNGYVREYNSRCHDTRYYVRDHEAVSRDLNSVRQSLMLEGRTRLMVLQ